MVRIAGWCRCEEKTDSNSTNSAGRDAVRKAPFTILPSHCVVQSAACLYRVSGFVSANGTKPKWQLWHRGGAARIKRNRKRWSGRDCCNPRQSPIGCPTYDFTESPPTSAYAGTSGFCKWYSVVHIELNHVIHCQEAVHKELKPCCRRIARQKWKLP